MDRPERPIFDWLQGRASLGAASGWTTEEIRLVADLAYWLAEQGRYQEAITIFEGLAALAPATAYFQSALGALWLRHGQPERALPHLETALTADPQDFTALINRAEARMLLGDLDGARKDLKAMLDLSARLPQTPLLQMCTTRARALLQTALAKDLVKR
ncbi:MAG: hypothetical protein C4334_14850 [Pyrinomonas sp.]|uniref:tetratricopeptide repeat protein n=1 Tax=Pyrinomonas sp. TaxID=2080306 RepID=UPI00332CA97E